MLERLYRVLLLTTLNPLVLEIFTRLRELVSNVIQGVVVAVVEDVL